MKTGKEFLETLPDDCKQSVCPVCLKSCNTVALVELVYTWEVCHCEKATYAHLRPTIYHKKCFIEQLTKMKNNKPPDDDA